MEALHQAADLEPNNPEGYHRLAVFYWEKAFRDHRLAKPEKVEYLQKGVDAENKALGLNPNYAEAMTYKNILLRLQANETTDREKQERLIAKRISSGAGHGAQQEEGVGSVLACNGGGATASASASPA